LTSKYQYIVDRYSQSLTKYEVQTLFAGLKEKSGSLSAATRDAELTRKTVYDWESSSSDIKMNTKRKVLETSLESDFYGTLEFIVKKTEADYNEILERYINTNISKILSTEDKTEFQSLVSTFDKYLKMHSGSIYDIKTINIDEIIDLLNQKALSLGVRGIDRDISLFSPQILSQKFIQLLEIINVKSMFKNEIAEKLKLPEEFIARAFKASSYIDPPTESSDERFGFQNPKANGLTVKSMGIENQPFPFALAQKK
jgi:hypothetical protein